MGIAAATDARHALLGRLIDHAPTFPPASLPPADALAEDRRARSSDHQFMLGRLVWPASRWNELGGEPRSISVVVDAPLPDDPRIESVEVHFGADVPPRRREVYVELPAPAVDELPRLAAAGLHAKVRCGGASVPAVPELAAFVRACGAAGVGFKATAGLHHAVRTDREHGLLNLLAAAVFGDEEEALAERDGAAFGLTADAFAWRDRVAGAAEVERVRHGLLHSIGSCSFFEPVEELVGLGIS